MSVRSVLAGLLLTTLPACGGGEPPSDGPDAETPAEVGVMEVVARGLTFDAPDSIPSGWTTIRFRNESPMIHFAAVERMPEGYGAAEQQEVVAPVFQDGMNLLAEGDVDGAMARFGALPAWFGEIVFMGGPGLTSPGLTSEATILLEPGTYLLECYVKTDGIFHSYNPDPQVMGMVREFRVTERSSGAPRPEPDVLMAISSTSGIEMAETPSAGVQTIAIHFTDQTVHENFVGHDVHLFRLPDDLAPTEVEAWMDWTRPEGLQTPAPAEFLGGLNEMPAGSTGYITVDLSPGRYAWVAEVPGAGEKGMLRIFEVAGE
jgi:hypothetical protein